MKYSWEIAPDIYIGDDIHNRFVLGVSGNNPLICFGVNPSIANNEYADKTLHMVEQIAKRNGFDSWIMFNVYPYRSTNPDCLPRACLKIHSDNLHAPLCGIFGSNSVSVARYASLIGAKSSTNCDAHLAESNFQTRSNTRDDDLHNENLRHIESYLQKSNLTIWAAWGEPITERDYLMDCLFDIYNIANKYSCQFIAFGKEVNGKIIATTRHDHPRHPSRLPLLAMPQCFDITHYWAK